MLDCRNQLMKKKVNLDYFKILQDIKNFSHIHAPAFIEPALSYALDWLSPELLGTGFKVIEFNDLSLQAEIPFHKKNCDFRGQIHQGLVVNASLEMIRMLISQHWPDQSWEILDSEIQLSKKMNWSTDLKLSLNADDSIIDVLIVDLQKGLFHEVDFEILIHTSEQSKKDKFAAKIKFGSKKLLT